MTESNLSIAIDVGPASNRKKIATDEANSVHTIQTGVSVGGAPVDSDNPMPVGDADVLAQLVVTNTALAEQIENLVLTITECIETPMRQMVAHLELITDTVFTPEDVEERDAYY